MFVYYILFSFARQFPPFVIKPIQRKNKMQATEYNGSKVRAKTAK
jgi:hypothetical protein